MYIGSVINFLRDQDYLHKNFEYYTLLHMYLATEIYFYFDISLLNKFTSTI
jgi:hypothetical protein